MKEENNNNNNNNEEKDNNNKYNKEEEEENKETEEKADIISTTWSRTQTVFLVRHAESEENRRIHALRDSSSALLVQRRHNQGSDTDDTSNTTTTTTTTTTYTSYYEQVRVAARALWDLLYHWPHVVNLDTPVSAHGYTQIEQLHTQWWSKIDDPNNNDKNENGIRVQQSQPGPHSPKPKKLGIKLILHSPLQRAKETCFGMLYGNKNNNHNKPYHDEPPKQDDDTNNNNNNHHHHAGVDDDDDVPVVVEQTPLLLEKTLLEWVVTSSFVSRRHAFVHDLLHRSETIILCVGHSQFFKALLQRPTLFDNCDVWQVDLTSSWSLPTILSSSLSSSSSQSSLTLADSTLLSYQFCNLRQVFSLQTAVVVESPPPQPQQPDNNNNHSRSSSSSDLKSIHEYRVE